MSTTNGGPAPARSTAAAAQRRGAIHQGFLVREPERAAVADGRQQQPQIAIQINVSAKPLSETDIEVTLKLEGKAETDGSLMFRFELDFAGVFRIQNVPQESLNAVVLIECPRLLFPFAREIIATAVRNGGFPPLLLDPVDFVGLYRQKMSEMQADRRAGAAELTYR